MEQRRILPTERQDASRTSLADAAYSALKASILEGFLPPGYEAAEQSVAEQLGMSRTPVHEAVLRLQHEGFVQVLSRRGVRVLPVASRDLRETYDILIALEGCAAELLAGQGARAQPTIGAMREATAAMEAALAAGDRRAWAAADDRFHRLLLAGCGNAKLARLAQTEMDQAQRARTLTSDLRPKPTASAAEHCVIMAALDRGDGAGAREAIVRHRSRASGEILATLERMRGAMP